MSTILEKIRALLGFEQPEQIVAEQMPVMTQMTGMGHSLMTETGHMEEKGQMMDMETLAGVEQMTEMGKMAGREQADGMEHVTEMAETEAPAGMEQMTEMGKMVGRERTDGMGQMTDQSSRVSSPHGGMDITQGKPDDRKM
jgi:hypothetical protein